MTQESKGEKLNERKILFWAFLVSLPACYFTWAPATLLLVATSAARIQDEIHALRSVNEPGPGNQEAAIKALAVLFKTLDESVKELRSEVNGLNLRAGLGK